jgi:hypothetical protein
MQKAESSKFLKIFPIEGISETLISSIFKIGLHNESQNYLAVTALLEKIWS